VLAPIRKIGSGSRARPRLSPERREKVSVAQSEKAVNRLESEARASRQGRLVDYLTRLDFVVLDELGYLPFAQTGGQPLFHLVSRLYERTSAFGEWPIKAFPLSSSYHLQEPKSDDRYGLSQ
jgi:hypothetical protein